MLWIVRQSAKQVVTARSFPTKPGKELYSIQRNSLNCSFSLLVQPFCQSHSTVLHYKNLSVSGNMLIGSNLAG